MYLIVQRTSPAPLPVNLNPRPGAFTRRPLRVNINKWEVGKLDVLRLVAAGPRHGNNIVMSRSRHS